MFTVIQMYLKANQWSAMYVLCVIKGSVGGACVHTAEGDSWLYWGHCDTSISLYRCANLHSCLFTLEVHDRHCFTSFWPHLWFRFADVDSFRKWIFPQSASLQQNVEVPEIKRSFYMKQKWKHNKEKSHILKNPHWNIRAFLFFSTSLLITDCSRLLCWRPNSLHHNEWVSICMPEQQV